MYYLFLIFIFAVVSVVQAKEVAVSFLSTLPSDIVGTPKEPFYLKNKAREKALYKVSDGVFIREKKLTNNGYRQSLIQITPLITNISKFTYSVLQDGQYQVDAVLVFDESEIGDLAERISGMGALVSDNAMLKLELAKYKEALFLDRANAIQSRKTKSIRVDVPLNSKSAHFVTGASESLIPTVIDYSDQELIDIAENYARLIENFVINNTKFKSFDVYSDHIGGERYSATFKWGLSVDVVSLKREYGNIFALGTPVMKNNFKRYDVEVTAEGISRSDKRKLNDYFKAQLMPVLAMAHNDDATFNDTIYALHVGHAKISGFKDNERVYLIGDTTKERTKVYHKEYIASMDRVLIDISVSPFTPFYTEIVKGVSYNYYQ